MPWQPTLRTGLTGGSATCPQAERMEEIRTRAREQVIRRIAPPYQRLRALAIWAKPCPVRRHGPRRGVCPS